MQAEGAAATTPPALRATSPCAGEAFCGVSRFYEHLPEMLSHLRDENDLVDLFVVSVHNAVIGRSALTGSTLRSLLCVQLFADGVEGLLALVGGSLDGFHIGTLQGFLQLFNSSQNGSLVALGDLVAQIGQSLFRLVNHLITHVACIDFVLAGLVFCCELFSFLDSLLNVFLAQVGGSGDGDVLLVAGAQILGGDVDDTVGVDVEGDFDLRNTTGGGSNAGQLELAQSLVVGESK